MGFNSGFKGLNGLFSWRLGYWLEDRVPKPVTGTVFPFSPRPGRQWSTFRLLPNVYPKLLLDK